MIPYYYYEEQLRKYMLQFCNIFTGLRVKTGKGECGTPEFITVPVRLGSKDRVVAAIESGNTQNKQISVPMMAAHMNGLTLDTSRKGIGVVDRRTYLPQGGVYPDDLRTAVRVMPIPYIMQMELSIYASNTDQLHQMLEQLLVLFDPRLQIQKNDAALDWTKITDVELVALSREENYPAGGDRRILVYTLSFDMPIYLSTPMDIRDEVVRKIFIQIGDLDGFNVEEFDENGQLRPFAPGAEYGTVVIDGS